jgi:signal peptidase II
MRKIWLLIAPVILAIDRLTKYWATRAAADAAGGVFAIWPGFIGFRYAQNTGMAFNFLAGQQMAVVAITVALVIISLLIVIFINSLSTGLRVGFILMSAGGIGNIIDRLAYGYVIDFIEFLFVDFAIFNIADIFITMGAATVTFMLLTGRDLNAHTRVDGGA